METEQFWKSVGAGRSTRILATGFCLIRAAGSPPRADECVSTALPGGRVRGWLYCPAALVAEVTSKSGDWQAGGSETGAWDLAKRLHELLISTESSV